MRFLFLVGACGLLGCVSFPHARLLHGTATLEVLTGPVVCGPVGIRNVPLQARWGEYVRVTVAAPASLRGTAVVHAGGGVKADQSWSTESTGALVVEARFPNEDPDRRFVLERERPIDITLNNLEGACEGAVFTVEHGALVPSIDERAWIAELVRRGGPELAARREAARLEAEARRQAHSALWDSRQQVVVSAQVVVEADSIRQAHYAQWEAQRTETTVSLSPAERDVPASVGVRADEKNVLAPTAVSGVGLAVGGASTSASGMNTTCGGATSNTSPGSCASGTCGANFANTTASACASGTCGGTFATPTISACASGTCGGNFVNTTISACASGTCGGTFATPTISTCASGNCGNSGMERGPSTSLANSGSGSGSASVSVSAIPMNTTASIATVTSPGEWSQPSDASLRANADVAWVQPPDASLRASGAVEASWTQPSDATLRANVEVARVQSPDASLRANGAVEASWTQPFEPRLEPVAVNTESRVAVAAPVAPSCNGNCSPSDDPALSFVVPAMLQLMFNVAAVSAPQPQGPVHGARPIGR